MIIDKDDKTDMTPCPWWPRGVEMILILLGVVHQGGVGGVEHFRQFQELHAMIFTVTSFVDTRSKIPVHRAPHTAAGRWRIYQQLHIYS